MQLNEIASTKQTIIAITEYNSDGKKHKMWTSTDGHGNYHLDQSGDVWYTDEQDNPMLHDLVDGKPTSKTPDYQVFSISGKFGVYDANTMNKIASVKNWHDGHEKIDQLKDY